jgi:hypothetical protein
MKVGGRGFLKRHGTQDHLPKEVFASEPSRSRAPQERPCRPSPKRLGNSALAAEDELLCPRKSVDPLGSATGHSDWQAAQALSRLAPLMEKITDDKALSHIGFLTNPYEQS